MLITTLGIASMAFVAAFTWRAYTRQDGDERARREAIVEAWVNIIIGFAANFVANLLLIPLMTGGGKLSASDNFFGGWVYTAISIVRQYAIRRWFHSRLEVFKKRMANWIGKFYDTTRFRLRYRHCDLRRHQRCSADRHRGTR